MPIFRPRAIFDFGLPILDSTDMPLRDSGARKAKSKIGNPECHKQCRGGITSMTVKREKTVSRNPKKLLPLPKS
jgi:hypothetical protein